MKNVPLLVYVGIFLLLFIPYALLMPRQPAFEILDVVCVAVGIGAASSYRKEAWEAVKLSVNKVLSPHYIVVAVLVTTVEMGLLFGGMWYWRIAGQPSDIINSIPILATRWLAVLALGLFGLTSYSNEGVISVTARISPTIVTSLALVALLGLWWGLS